MIGQATSCAREELGMGHTRLGVLPRSRKWQQVIEELRLGSGVNIIAAAAADAAEAGFQRASTD